MKERGVSIDHSTLNRWVIKYAKELEATFSKKFRKYGANEAALLSINIFLFLLRIWLTHSIEIRQNKYLNNLIEQDHRNIKRLTRPMLGFKAWDSMKFTIAGYELVNMIKKDKHINAGKMTVWDQFYAIAA